MSSCVLAFDRKVYEVEAVKKAAYRFIDQFSVQISLADDIIQCEFTFPANKTDESIEYSLSEFKKELLDQDLRSSIKKETEGVRNLILAHAFSKTSLVNE
jgi:His-Xaa-Ser system protein HxsD